ncbi:MAG TPA: PDZ domain-containing protein [Terriglobia bacterium]|nr:PDZ domain-containing protein [Terriglobia bacterium]
MKHRLALGALVVLGSCFLTGGALLAQRARTMGQDVQILTNDGGWLGVRLEDITAQKAQDLKAPGQYGALVTEVEPDSPAAKAGLQVNDVIVDFAGDKVRSVASLRRMVRETPVDRTVPIEILRNGERRTLNVTVEARRGVGNEFFGFAMPTPPPPPEGPEMRMPPHAFEFTPPGSLWNGWFGGARLGIRGEDLTEQLAGYFGVKQGKGVLVAEVERGSAAEKAGMRAGDCIVRVDSKDVASVEELHEALTNSARGPSNKSQVTLTIVRDHHEQSLPVTLEDRRMEPMMESLDEWRPEDLAKVEGEIAALGPELREQAARWQRQWPEETKQLREQIQAAARAQVAAAAAERAQLAGQLETMRRQLNDQNSELNKAMEQARKQMLDQQKERLLELRRGLSAHAIV